MPKMRRRILALITVSILMVAPVTMAATPATDTEPAITPLTNWVQWLSNLWTSATSLQAASTEPAPADPQPLPSDPDLDSSTTESPDGDGETLPNMDPWG